MPTDLQIIDGFEGLRAAFMAANPGAATRPAASVAAVNAPVPAERALEAWLCAALGFDEPTGQQKRWLRALGRMADPAADEGGNGAADEPGLAQLLARNPGLAEDARAALGALGALAGKDGMARLPGAIPSLSAEAAAWSRALPRLGGVKAYRMLRHLGRAAIAPDAPVRRFLWRIGALESERAEAAAAASCLEGIAQSTGFPAEEIGALIRWHTRSDRQEGSGRCGKAPRCEGCPFAAGCLWFRFHGADARAEDDPAAPTLDAIKHKLDVQGAEALDDAELLSVALQAGAGDRGAFELAESLIRKFGDLRAIYAAAPSELRDCKGVGEARARRIKAGLELGRRVAIQPLRPGDAIGGSADVWNVYRHRYEHIPQEHFVTLMLDTKNRVIQTHIVSKGTLNGSLAHPREVFKEAIRRSASAVILLHNHPSGDPSPSPEDVSLTQRLAEAGKILGIRVLDHVILGSGTYYSFKDENRI